MSVKARVKCNCVADHGHYREVTLNPVVTSEDDDPNKSFSKYTPDGEIKLSITNPEAFSQFVPGEIYDVDFTKHSA